MSSSLNGVFTNVSVTFENVTCPEKLQSKVCKYDVLQEATNTICSYGFQNYCIPKIM